MNPNNPQSTTLPVGIPPRFAFMAWTLEVGRSLSWSKIKIPLCAILSLVLGALILGPTYSQQVTSPKIGAMICAYNASPPTVTTGNFVQVQCNASGQLVLH